eukprot:scaffold2428_cov80-Isochrysis_galbana.AAC.4
MAGSGAKLRSAVLSGSGPPAVYAGARAGSSCTRPPNAWSTDIFSPVVPIIDCMLDWESSTPRIRPADDAVMGGGGGAAGVEPSSADEQEPPGAGRDSARRDVRASDICDLSLARDRSVRAVCVPSPTPTPRSACEPPVLSRPPVPGLLPGGEVALPFLPVDDAVAAGPVLEIVQAYFDENGTLLSLSRARSRAASCSSTADPPQPPPLRAKWGVSGCDPGVSVPCTAARLRRKAAPAEVRAGGRATAGLAGLPRGKCPARRSEPAASVSAQASSSELEAASSASLAA